MVGPATPGRPGKGNDKSKVEGLVGLIQRNFPVPLPRAASEATRLAGAPVDHISAVARVTATEHEHEALPNRRYAASGSRS